MDFESITLSWRNQATVLVRNKKPVKAASASVSREATPMPPTS